MAVFRDTTNNATARQTSGRSHVAASCTAVPRSLTIAVSPMMTLSPFGWLRMICGGLEIVYDPTLLAMIPHVPPPAEPHSIPRSK